MGGFPQLHSTGVILHDVLQGPGTTGVVILQQTERLDAIEPSMNKLGDKVSPGDNSGSPGREEGVAESATSKDEEQQTINTCPSLSLNKFLVHPLLNVRTRIVTIIVRHL